jgi:uncharacterized damage-inducible protein DinB
MADMTERERWNRLFRQQLSHTNDFLAVLRPEDWRAVPRDSDTLFLGTRVRRITIGALVGHLITAEENWLGELHAVSEGGDIPIPRAEALDALPQDERLAETYRAAINRISGLAEQLTEADLKKTVTFGGRRYTGMGLLWAVLAHHSFHLGQIDLVMRQQGRGAPEFMEWPETAGIVA